MGIECQNIGKMSNLCLDMDPLHTVQPSRILVAFYNSAYERCVQFMKHVRIVVCTFESTILQPTTGA